MIVKGFKLPITNGIYIPFDDVNEGSEYEPYIKTLLPIALQKVQRLLPSDHKLM